MRARSTLALKGAFLIAAVTGVLLQLSGGGCAQNQVTVPTRSLNRSGRVSFVCLGPPTSSVFYMGGEVERDLSECSGQQLTSTCQYQVEDDAGDVDAGATPIPHLYALVTQTTTGEVAVVDTNSVSLSVLDENPREPGANFLPIGGQPTGIVSTPGSVATFVGVSELGQEGFFGLPSSTLLWTPPPAGAADPDLGSVIQGTPNGGISVPGIRPLSDTGTPDTCLGTGGGPGVDPLYNMPVAGLTSWPACYLGYAPGDVILVDDPAIGGEVRTSCDDPVYQAPTDLITTQEQQGRPKIIATVPDLGGIVVIDADWLLARRPGTFDECKVERFLQLEFTGSDYTSLSEQPLPPTGPACTNPLRGDIPLQTSYTVKPSGLSYDGNGTLYVADVGAPVIHVVDLHDVVNGNAIVTPCNPVERAPLLPTSAVDPTRVVYASRVSVAQLLTPDLKRYLYATDLEDASAMVFDVSDDSTTRRPLERMHPEWDPFEPRDRVKFSAPAADIIVVQRDLPQIDPTTGVAVAGVSCDPNPAALTCPPSTGNTCDIGTRYRTSEDYTTGAGPNNLRGEFAFAALTNGKLAVIDIDDFDAPCRTPVHPSLLAGCSSNAPAPIDIATELISAADVSCNTVEPFGARDSYYQAVGAEPGNHVPGIDTFPQLYNADGSVYSTAVAAPPQMVATLPVAANIPAACTQQGCDPHACSTACDDLPGCPLQLFVGSVQTPLNLPGNGGGCVSLTGGGTPGAIGTSSALVMNLEDLRAQIGDQNWSVTYEGGIPGFQQQVGYLWSHTMTDPTQGTCDPGKDVLCDSSARFCDAGVLSQNAMSEMLASQPTPPCKTDADCTVGSCDPVALVCKTTNLGAEGLADYVQVLNDLPDPLDPYWNTGLAFAGQPICFPPDNDCTADGGTSGGTICSAYGACLDAFGTIEVPVLSPCRDLRIVEAYEDHVELAPRNPTQGQCQDSRGNPITAETIQCCFPGALSFTVRGGGQWMVTGDQSGFLHHVVPDAATGKCRNSCDPTLDRLNSRVVETPTPAASGTPTALSTVVLDRVAGALDPTPAFMNPMFRFAVLSAQPSTNAVCVGGTGTGQPDGVACTKNADCCTGFCNPNNLQCGVTGQRDAIFHFTTYGSFAPLTVGLAATTSALVEPQAITYLSPTQEVVITDGTTNGIIFVSLGGSGVSRSYY